MFIIIDKSLFLFRVLVLDFLLIFVKNRFTIGIIEKNINFTLT